MYRAIKLESLPRGALIESTVLRRPPQPSILGAAVVVTLRLSQWQFSGAIKKKSVDGNSSKLFSEACSKGLEAERHEQREMAVSRKPFRFGRTWTRTQMVSGNDRSIPTWVTLEALRPGKGLAHN